MGNMLPRTEEHELWSYLWMMSPSAEAVAFQAAMTFPGIHFPLFANKFLFLCSKRIASRKELIFTEHLQQSVAVLSTFMNEIILPFKIISFLGETRETGHLLNMTKVKQLICRRFKIQTQACLTPNTERLALWTLYKGEGSAKSPDGNLNIENICLVLPHLMNHGTSLTLP